MSEQESYKIPCEGCKVTRAQNVDGGPSCRGGRVRMCDYKEAIASLRSQLSTKDEALLHALSALDHLAPEEGPIRQQAKKAIDEIRKALQPSAAPLEEATKDAAITGQGFIKDGACVDPDSVFKSVEDHEVEQLRYLEKQIRLWKSNGGGNLSGVIRHDINACLNILDGLRGE